jgi:DNA-binding transcriptional MerR regulator
MTIGMTIASASAQAGLPESTLRYWERIGLIEPVDRDPSSRHRRYSDDEVARLESLANLRAVGLSIEDMRAYLSRDFDDDAIAGEQRTLFEAHARRLHDDIAVLRLRLAYLDLKVEYWHARELGDSAAADAVVERLRPVTQQMHETRHGDPTS